MPDPINIQKIKAIILYFAQNTDSRYLGKVKLMKLFYFLDFVHVKRYGYPVTFDQYFHLEHGPVPTVIKNLVDEVDSAESVSENSILTDIISIQKNLGQNIHRIVAKKELDDEDLKILAPTEMEILKEVSVRFEHTKTEDIEKISHEEYPWKSTSIGDPIPYVFYC